MASIRDQRRAVCLLIGMMFLAGCGQEESIPPAEDLRTAEVYGSDIKSRAMQILAEAKKSPARTSELAAHLSELLEGYEKRPVGEHAAKYKGLREGAQELQTLAEKSSPDVKKKLDELQALAESLPGAIKVVGDDLNPNRGETDQ